MDFKNIAWDGISFEIPSNFEVSGIDKKFLQLDNGEYPCIELRWYDAGRTYKEKTYFRQLAKKIESASGLKIESTVLPSSWKGPLKKYNTTGFYWQSDLATGRGVMFYCKNAAKVMLVQFIGQCDDQIDDAAVKLFNSLKFHDSDSERLWQIYDMKAAIPGSMDLESFEFKPGRFNITLTDQTETIELFRFSPADVILKDTTLGDFSRELFKDDIKSLGLSIAELEYDKGATCMFGQEKSPSTTKLALAKLNSKRRPYGQIEIRYTQESNRIMAVMVKSRQHIPEDRAKNIFRNYEIIQ
ncbi:hypothetical protein [Maridesulfovibrio salexigens]|uniref:Uncharacterized protein n=1 Tax=Maridesulfovibrio salexigens (strain ATCC 14822 / DSM 2638 / NCIMB 8403 / VKM B-1763) TaxID=526222 RepID=C6BTN7_MARSD|nr:hypothetical protein [Maridesulfovibrio salexigens]ACS79817.1 hypothetical protein Desal_1755 [Maridesulfovibrio salexigens DSM 2638]